MKVIILAGGFGTRLRPLTFCIPKPLIPIGEKPILEIILEKFKKAGLKEIFLCVGYKSEIIESYFGDGKKFCVNITYVKEKERLGTGGPIRLVEKYLKKEDKSVLVMNGDILTKLNFRDIIKFHNKNKASMTVGSVIKEINVKYGILDIKNNVVLGLKEKPSFKFNASAGIYMINKDVIKLIPKNKFFDITDLMLKCIKLHKKVMAYPIKESWLAIDRINDLNQALKNVDKDI